MPTDLLELRNKWRRRFTDAKLRLDFARAFVKDSLEDCESGTIPSSDAVRAYRRALNRERDALAEFDRIAEVLKNLILHHTVPDEDRDQGTKDQPA
jgi:hypothetical protein